MTETCTKPAMEYSLYQTTTISTALTKKLGLYDSLIFSKLRDVVANASLLGLKTKRLSNVFPKNIDVPVTAQWTRLKVKQVSEFLPFLSSRTVERHLRNLETYGLVYCSPLNQSPVDTTCWYAINTDKLKSVLNEEVGG